MQMVEDEYGELFPGQVVAVETVHDTSKLESLAATYKTENARLWDLIGDYSSKKRVGRKVKRSQVTRFNDIWASVVLHCLNSFTT